MIERLDTERRPKWAALPIALGLLVLAAVMLWDAHGLKQDGGYAGVGPADVPRLIAYGLIVLAGVTIWAGFRGDMPAPPRQDPAPVLWILGGLGLQLALLHVAGFVVASGLLFGFTARGLGRKPLWLTVLVGFAVTFVIYAVFDRILKLNLPAGPLELAIFRG